MDQGREEQEFWKAHERLKGGGGSQDAERHNTGVFALVPFSPAQLGGDALNTGKRPRQFTCLPFPSITHLVDVVA